MAHGTDQAVAGLGDGSVIGTGGNAADADNRLASLASVLDIEASEVDVDTTSVIGTSTVLQTVLEDLTTELVTTHPAAADPHTGYRLESADHTHASTGAQAGNIATSSITGLDTTLATELSYRPVYSTLTADSADRNNSEVMLASGLSVTVPVAGTYDVEAFLPYTTAAAADLELKFGGTATVTVTVGTSDLWIINKPTGDATAGLAIASVLPTSWTTAFSVLTTGAPADGSPIIIRGKLVVTVVGTIIIEFTQDTADVSNTHIGAGAWLKLQRVA